MWIYGTENKTKNICSKVFIQFLPEIVWLKIIVLFCDYFLFLFEFIFYEHVKTLKNDVKSEIVSPFIGMKRNQNDICLLI